MMRSAWDKKDLPRPTAVSLRFGPEEAERIRRNVSERMGDGSFQISVSEARLAVPPRGYEEQLAGRSRRRSRLGYFSGQQLVDQAAAYVGEAEVAALIAEGELHVI